MPEHTPGPWRFRVADSGDPAGIQIYSVNGESVATIKSARSRGITDERKAANARLIAAAPTMAETLLWIRENLHPKALGRAATDAELIAIGRATMVLREAGVIPTPVLEP